MLTEGRFSTILQIILERISNHSREEGNLVKGLAVAIRALLFPILLLSCGKKEEEGIVLLAKVGSKQITVADMERVFRPQPGWSAEEFETAKEEVLNRLIKEKLLALEAERMGYRNDEDVNENLEVVVEKAMVNQLYRNVVMGKAKVGDGEVKSFYNRLGEEVKIRHIMLESEKQADSVYTELTEKKKDFDELVKLTIDTDTKGKGGDLGWVRWGGGLPDEFERVAFSLKAGETSKPVKSNEGYHIIRVDDRREVERKPYEEWKGKIKNWLEMRKVKRLETEYFEEMKTKAKIKINEEILANLVNKTPEPDRETLAPAPLPLVTEEEREKSLVSSIVGGLTVGEVLKEMEKDRRRPSFKQLDEAKRFIEFLATYRFLVAEAKKLQLERSPEVMLEIESQIDSRMAAKLSKETYDNIKAGEGELVGFYKAHIEDYYTQPKRVQASEILVETEEEAKEILKRLRRGEDFAELAKEKSIHSSKERGGDLGLIAMGMYPDIEEAAFRLKPGEISDVLKTKDGFAIIKVTQKLAKRIQPFDNVKESVETAFRMEKWEGELEKLLSRLRSETQVETFEGNLSLIGS